MSGKVHVLPDENLGGVLREYVEVDREAEVGDLIKVVKACDPNQYDEGGIYKVRQVSEHIRIDSKYGGTVFMYDDEYVVIEPTDIVHIDGVRYRLVDRKAKVGEKVIVTADWFDKKKGEILTVIDGNDFGFTDANYTYYEAESNEYGERISYIGEHYYRVLAPVEPTQTAETEPVEVDTRHASPQVIDMLANLAQRVTELERELSDVKKVTNTEMGARSVHTERWLEVKDEIDTLHANQRKLAEETTNRLDRHSERIRELAEMIGEQKTFKIDIDNRYVLEVKRK
jgi:DNA-binding ferritin-like protein